MQTHLPGNPSIEASCKPTAPPVDHPFPSSPESLTTPHSIQNAETSLTKVELDLLILTKMDSSRLPRFCSAKPAASLAWTFANSPTRIWRQPNLLKPRENPRFPAPQLGATGAKNKLCRQGITHGVAPLLLTCPPGSAVLSPAPLCRPLHGFARTPDRPFTEMYSSNGGSRQEAATPRCQFPSQTLPVRTKIVGFMGGNAAFGRERTSGAPRPDSML